MLYPPFAERLLALRDRDLQVRDHLLRSGQLNDGYHEEMELVHNENATAMEELIEQIGYPTADKVGAEAAAAAWLVVQHAIGRPAFMRKCARLLARAVSEDGANPLHLAYLTDRIATFENRPQRYGTQFDWDEHGALSPNPCDDVAEVDRRRKALGLPSLKAQTAIIRRRAGEEGQTPPDDLPERNRELEKWKRTAGWIE